MKRYQGHEMGKMSSEDPEERSRLHRTNEFNHRASESMGLEWEKGQLITKALLRNIIESITSDTAKSFISNLPLGHKQECSSYAIGPLKSVCSEKVLNDIRRAAKGDAVDAKAIARLFWLFLEGELNAGLLHRVQSDLPRDLKAIFSQGTFFQKDELS